MIWIDITSRFTGETKKGCWWWNLNKALPVIQRCKARNMRVISALAFHCVVFGCFFDSDMLSLFLYGIQGWWNLPMLALLLFTIFACWVCFEIVEVKHPRIPNVWMVKLTPLKLNINIKYCFPATRESYWNLIIWNHVFFLPQFLLKEDAAVFFWRCTPWKITMEPTNHPFRKEHDLPNLHYCVPCLIFRGRPCSWQNTQIPGGSKPAETNSVGRKRWMVKSGEWLFLLSQAVSVFFVGICFVLWTLLPGKLTWNPKMELLEDDFPLQAGDFQVPC